MSLKGVTSLVITGVFALVWGSFRWYSLHPAEVCDAFPLSSPFLDLAVQPSWRTVAARFSLPPYLPQIQHYPLDRSTLAAYADRLTVQVWGAEGLLGSGTLLGRSSLGVGWVLTNDHVLRWSTPPFRVRFSDRTVLNATWVEAYHFDGADLAVLQVANFPSHLTTYATPAPLSLNPIHSQAVFASGWIAKDYYPHWQFMSGTVVYQLAKPLTGGYQFGYSSTVEKGMSGGPVLNAWGQLIGLNGMVSEPLWELEHTYEDGTTLDPSIQNLIYGRSWGIPSDRFASVSQEVNFSQHDRFFCTL